MPLPQKRWFRVAEVAERWHVTPGDIEDYALDELLELSVLVDRLPAEEGTMEPHDQAGYLPVLQDLPLLNGPQPLLRSSLLAAFRTGQAEVHAFRSRLCGGYLRLLRDVPPVPVRREDLIVTREERDRFEAEHGLAITPEPALPREPVLSQEGDFHVLHVRGETWRLGPIQASVIRGLYEAWLDGNPWVPGKTLLARAGASSMRMRDLFKAHPGWRILVVSDGRGHYRLNLPVQEHRLYRRLNSWSAQSGRRISSENRTDNRYHLRAVN